MHDFLSPSQSPKSLAVATGYWQAPMFSLTKRIPSLAQLLQSSTIQIRSIHRRRSKSPPFALNKAEETSEWWIVDGEIHEIGDHVPPRERFVIPRDNIPNKRRKQLREQFMRRTRLVLKESVLHCSQCAFPLSPRVLIFRPSFNLSFCFSMPDR